MKLLRKMIIAGLFLVLLPMTVHAIEICYGPYLLPDGREVNTCGRTINNSLLSGVIVRTKSVAQNSGNNQVEHLILRFRFWVEENNVCFNPTDVPRSCAFCSDTQVFWGTPDSTFYYPSGNWYEITKHKLAHNGAQNLSVSPPQPPKPFWSRRNSAGHTTPYKRLYNGKDSPTILGCDHIAPPAYDPDADD